MADFFSIKERSPRANLIEIFPDFKVKRSKDLMVRGKGFYAIWDPERNLWSTDEYDVQRLVDKDLLEYKNSISEKTDSVIHVKFMSDFSTNAWSQFRKYLSNISDSYVELDQKVTFQNTEVKKTDYVSRRLPYSLDDSIPEAYNELMSVIYEPEERAKLEWAIGAILSGDAKTIQKFIVLYGDGGSGKSTFLNIVQKLFSGYYTTFEAQALTSGSNGFSTEVFRNNPLVAIQHDGDLSKIQDNTKLNSIVSHEEMTMNEKYKPSYTARANCFLFIATNKPVRITDAKSGIIRRLIDVRPSGKTVPVTNYHSLISRIDFELGSIANRCLEVYNSMGKNYFSTYKPLDMILQTDIFFNFVEENYYTFVSESGVSLTRAYAMYKEFCDESSIGFKLPRYKFRDEFKNYFREFYDITRIDGKQVRSYYSDFIKEKFEIKERQDEFISWITLDSTDSLFDNLASNWPAQYASEKYQTPRIKWADNKKVLSELNTSKLHYVKVPKNHIVIDFDIKDDSGNKSPEKNILEASKFPPTYVEFSKSKAGLHLHYTWDGDVDLLSRLYSEGIEVKVFSGDASLRRQLSKCNNIPVATINSGIPLREKKMINFEAVKSEKVIRDLIYKNLNKEIHGATKPSIDFIYKILEDAYSAGTPYDVRDLRPKVFVFANNSTNQSDYCVKLVSKMKFNSDEGSIDLGDYEDDRLIFFDVEVFPNLFLISWKFEGPDSKCIHMINPSPKDVEDLFKMKLVGFNNRRYDNHILYARYLGYDNEMLYKVSEKIISGQKRALFREAYNLSYADVYDFTSKKQSLKKYQIELGLHHQELAFPFDEPLPEEYWPLAMEYCENDVITTEATFNNRKEDFVARKILAELSGLTVNDSTLSHTSRIIFGDVRQPQSDFVYTDLSKTFPGYTFNMGKSSYKGENPGEGGYVYAEKGYYQNVSLLDVASMHPTSIIALNLFGPYTSKYEDLIKARLSIKRGDIETAKSLFDGKLEKYLSSIEDADALSYALKIVINIVYGLTSAKFPNPFKDDRNVDNIVAKRGALFMMDLKDKVVEKGGKVIHVKTDSLKVPDCNSDIKKFIFEFGEKYGYTFEHEATYEKICLVNDAVYIAKKDDGKWVAVGAEFAHPYVFKTLFSKEPITFEDLCETKSVTTALYLDLNEGLEEDQHNYNFIGRAGLFCPIVPGVGAGILLRRKDDKYHAATGTKGYRWLESEMVLKLNLEESIDYSYFRKLVDDAVDHISEFIPIDEFLD